MRGRRWLWAIAVGTASVVAPLLPTTRGWAAATLNGHTVQLDSSGGIVPWTTPPANGYHESISLATGYLLNDVPVEPNGKPSYYSHSFLNPDTNTSVNWPHNPAGLYAMFTDSALGYYAYSGDPAFIALARGVVDHHLAMGMTPIGWQWPAVPYASGDSGSLTYQGAAFGDISGQGDGRGVIEPDKVGELGVAFAKLYRFTGDPRYREAAITAADVLAAKVRTGTETVSPWPFRVYAQTGMVREEYSAHVIAPIKLFDELTRLGLGDVARYRVARQVAWDWMMTYPIRNNLWANYFEDVGIEPGLNNVNQLNAMEVARYLLQHPEYDANWEAHVRGLIAWVEATFAIPSYGANSIREQAVYPYAMGSHTARYASVNAMLYERTGDLAAREKAYRAFNWATYMTRPNGRVIVGPDPTVSGQMWFTDGYGDYIKHFLAGLGAIPEWAPSAQSHLLRSDSIVTKVTYGANSIDYQTADRDSTEVLRLNFAPGTVLADGLPLSRRADLSAPGWTFDDTQRILRVRHAGATQILIGTRQADTSPPAAPANLVASATSSSQVELNWSAASDDTGVVRYQVFRNASPSPVAEPTSTGYLDGGLTGGTTYTYVVRAVDGAGNVSPASAPATATTPPPPPPAPPPALRSTLFAPDAVPTVTSDPDTEAVEVGVKFQASTPGFVTGVRFYKGSGNTGTHVANLWSANGARLASATFTSETASGWQEVSFATPVALAANTTYIVSYFAPVGRYAADPGYFDSDVVRGPLRAPASGASGGNGVYRYSASGGFPAETWQSANYWVDPVFSVNGTDPQPA
jgi:hypothetical protein